MMYETTIYCEGKIIKSSMKENKKILNLYSSLNGQESENNHSKIIQKNRKIVGFFSPKVNFIQNLIYFRFNI